MYKYGLEMDKNDINYYDNEMQHAASLWGHS